MAMCPHPTRPGKLIFDPTLRKAQQLLVSTLQALPALSRLDVSTTDPPFGPRALHAATLLHGISGVTQLVSLPVPPCIDCNAATSSQLPPQTEREAVLTLSRLTWLTHLRLDHMYMNKTWAAVFALVIESLVALQTLDVVFTTQYVEEDDWLKAQSVTTRSRAGSVREGMARSSRVTGGPAVTNQRRLNQSQTQSQLRKVMAPAAATVTPLTARRCCMCAGPRR